MIKTEKNQARYHTECGENTGSYEEPPRESAYLSRLPGKLQQGLPVREQSTCVHVRQKYRGKEKVAGGGGRRQETKETARDIESRDRDRDREKKRERKREKKERKRSR